jgi:hypothetical protein
MEPCPVTPKGHQKRRAQIKSKKVHDVKFRRSNQWRQNLEAFIGWDLRSQRDVWIWR